MSSPVDVEESPEISSVGDYKTPLLSHPRKSDLFCEPFGRFMSNDRTFGDYSDASPEKEVGESYKYYDFACGFVANYIQKRIEYFRTIFGDCKQSKAEEAPFFWSSSLLGTCGQKRELVTAWSEEEIKDYGYTPIHEAASNGDLETLRTLIVRNANECLRRDKHGGTPLHEAARRGRVEALKVILEACPETVKMVTVPGENCLHTAVLYNQVGAVRFLVEWLERNRDYAHLINGKDYDGKTPLHLATSRKQIQTLEVLLTCNVVDVNAMCSGSFSALDILDVLPCTGKIGLEINRILGQAGAMRARDLANRDANSYAAEDNKRKRFKTIDMSTIIPFIKMGLLLMATLVTTITYEAAFTAAGATLNEGGGALCFFMWFNLLAFFGSLAVGMIVISKYSILAA